MRAWFARSDDYGFALVLILATIIVLATIGSAPAGQFVAVALSGGTLMFVLHTSRARPRVFRFAAAVVIGGIAISGIALLLGLGAWGSRVAGLIGLLLAFVAPVAIARRLIMQGTISVKTVLGALCFYLLIGLFFAWVYPLVGQLQGQSFFVQVQAPQTGDFVYFSYITITTVGYGDFTAASNFGRMLAASEALIGQLYLVSVVALLVGNIGRSRRPAGGDAPPGVDAPAGERQE